MTSIDGHGAAPAKVPLGGVRAAAVTVGVAVLCAGMIGLFAVPPLFAPVAWFAVMLTLVFSAFSFLTICFYAQGVATGTDLPDGGHLRLARWRETGALLGVCVAAIAPVMLGAWLQAPFAGFALGFAVLGLVALGLMRSGWDTAHIPDGPGFRVILQDALARRLLLIALVNAAPVAVSSTLFLFFVESRLGAVGMEGPLLLLFFACAAGSAPIDAFASGVCSAYGQDCAGSSGRLRPLGLRVQTVPGLCSGGFAAASRERRFYAGTEQP